MRYNIPNSDTHFGDCSERCEHFDWRILSEGSPLKYRPHSAIAAIRNGTPPTKVILMKVVSADSPYITLRPKLSGSVLSMPEGQKSQYRRAHCTSITHPRNLYQICSEDVRERRYRGSVCSRTKHLPEDLTAACQ